MADKKRYQPGNEDYELVQELNRISESGKGSVTPDDRLYSYLDAYKKSVSLNTNENADTGLWGRIAAEMNQSERHITSSARFFRLSNPYMKIAAVLMVFVMLSLLYFALPDKSSELIASSESQKTEVILQDGSEVTLRPYSTLALIDVTEAQVIYEVSGEAFFNVVSNENRRFSVIADGARVDVTGTRFTLRNWGSSVSVFLEEGSVKFSTADYTETVSLIPGQASDLTESGISEPVQARDNLFTGWLQDELILDQRNLDDIISELSHQYQVDIKIPDELKGESLSGTIRFGELEDVLNDLGLSLNGEFRQTDRNSYRFESNP